MSFDQSFEYLLGWEGGFSNDPRDPGGATNLGVIQTEYDAYRRVKDELPQSVRNITKAEAEDIYRTKYWNAAKCDQLNPGVANATFDACVNSGVSRGARWLQQAVNQIDGRGLLVIDEAIGPLTLAAASRLHADKLIDAMLERRLAFMKVAKNPQTGALLWDAFGKGWSARINGVRKQSHALAGLPQPQETSIMNWLGTLLANAQIQSIFRSVLKVAGTALVVKAGGDIGSVDTIVGAIVTLIGAFGSIVTHSPVAAFSTQAVPTQAA